MWAQVKGRTEAALLGLFRNGYMVRLGMLRPVHGEVSRTRWARVLYAVLGPLAPLIQALAPGMVITSEELGRAMIRAARERPPTHVLEMRESSRRSAAGEGASGRYWMVRCSVSVTGTPSMSWPLMTRVCWPGVIGLKRR